MTSLKEHIHPHTGEQPRFATGHMKWPIKPRVSRTKIDVGT